MIYYQQKIESVFSDLDSRTTGLLESEAISRLRSHGLNQLSNLKRSTIFVDFFKQFADTLALILICAAILAYFIGEPRDGLIIISIVIINAVIGFIQEYKAEKILATFKNHLPSFSKVFRSNQLKKALTVELVPGDVIFFEAGDAIGADARIIECFDLKTNELSLTGESEEKQKTNQVIADSRVTGDQNNMVFMGTTVVEGSGKAVVTSTGLKTAFGQIAKQSQVIKEEFTPLQKELRHTGKIVAIIALAIAVVTLLIFFLLGKELHESLLFAVAAGAAMVPEGLPAATSIALSLGAQRMLKHKALVKKLLHVESLGSITTICTDKTGTLTEGKMTVVDSSFNDSSAAFRVLTLCNNASIGENSVGDPLEQALLNFANDKIDISKILKENRRTFEIPFSSYQKKMSVVVESAGEKEILTKGATFEILANCNLTADEKKKIIAQNDKYAQNGLKILALAKKKLKTLVDIKNEGEKNLDFIGLVALEDPPRAGVKNAIEVARKAKIKIIMVTGDYSLTAESIGNKIGLTLPDTEVFLGSDLHRMDDQKLKSSLKDGAIFARIEPDQKLRIVTLLQAMGELVAVTGDGVNDVPAMVKADIGIAMGRIGSDVTKEAADMVLLDDHFATIINAIKEGRRIFDNAKKLVYYVFSSNAGELFTPLIGILLGLPLALTAIQILAIDLGTDVFPSLALSLEKEEKDIMKEGPRSKDVRIFGVPVLYKLLKVGLIMAVFGLTVFLLTMYAGGWRFGETLSENSPLYFRATASVYAVLVACQAANAFSTRSDHQTIFQLGFFTNIYLLWSEVISFIMLMAMMYFPPLQNIFHTRAPQALEWSLIIASFVIFLAIFELEKSSKSKETYRVGVAENAS